MLFAPITIYNVNIDHQERFKPDYIIMGASENRMVLIRTVKQLAIGVTGKRWEIAGKANTARFPANGFAWKLRVPKKRIRKWYASDHQRQGSVTANSYRSIRTSCIRQNCLMWQCSLPTMDNHPIFAAENQKTALKSIHLTRHLFSLLFLLILVNFDISPHHGC